MVSQNDANEVAKLIIIGSGPAGYTAAIYAARALLNPIVFEGSAFGGALMNTTEVENYPGFPAGIMGPELMSQWREQAEKFGADLRMEDVQEVTLQGDVKRVVTDSGVFLAHAVILAMGSQARSLGIPGEAEFAGRGVSSCATCDGFFFKNHDIAVVGGGDTAMEEAIFLTKFARSVTLIHRSHNFRASSLMLERARKHPKITFLANHTVVSAHGEGSLSGIQVSDVTSGATSKLDITGLFIAIGHDPRNHIVKDLVELDESGYIRVQGRSSLTNIPGIFAAGDIIDSKYQQAVTAAGSGCAAAIDAEHYLQNILAE